MIRMLALALALPAAAQDLKGAEALVLEAEGVFEGRTEGPAGETLISFAIDNIDLGEIWTWDEELSLFTTDGEMIDLTLERYSYAVDPADLVWPVRIQPQLGGYEVRLDCAEGDCVRAIGQQEEYVGAIARAGRTYDRFPNSPTRDETRPVNIWIVQDRETARRIADGFETLLKAAGAAEKPIWDRGGAQGEPI